jgi:hypothetical protein
MWAPYKFGTGYPEAERRMLPLPQSNSPTYNDILAAVVEYTIDCEREPGRARGQHVHKARQLQTVEGGSTWFFRRSEVQIATKRRNLAEFKYMAIQIFPEK